MQESVEISLIVFVAVYNGLQKLLICLQYDCEVGEQDPDEECSNLEESNY